LGHKLAILIAGLTNLHQAIPMGLKLRLLARHALRMVRSLAGRAAREGEPGRCRAAKDAP
jgi:hypothetical protein